ncbi:CKLF-like MARVEL transmembrane domain-containing protein 7 isoform X2 [Boleophthalmus pectinirostris]|uniref:CKLF-like MARVEL transmembrane domain-containing protein 7 isoform X2 n=1 Tax=Boleophthalmus pectinirostris TaxID=150288 RepID=UPI00242CD13E|nr:CKLF-like MARVEL transmembrane domain-containing protein 7 isoform X2 [Boleophthalmus pectinirostris]
MSHAVGSTSTSGTRTPDGLLNLGYIRTIPGLLQSGQLVALLVTFLCIHLARGWPSWYAFQFFEVVALWFFVALLVFFFIHIFSLNSRTPCINCPLTVFGFITSFLMLVSLWTTYSVSCGAHQTVWSRTTNDHKRQ